jgi:hypothetical protein
MLPEQWKAMTQFDEPFACHELLTCSRSMAVSGSCSSRPKPTLSIVDRASAERIQEPLIFSREVSADPCSFAKPAESADIP